MICPIFRGQQHRVGAIIIIQSDLPDLLAMGKAHRDKVTGFQKEQLEKIQGHSLLGQPDASRDKACA